MALVQRLMLRLLPYRWRDSVEGDIEEERQERLEAGERAGTLWFVSYGGRLIASIAADEVRDFLGRRQGFTPADIAADFRYGARVLRASPGYFFGVLGSLSIGIAAMAVGFSIIDAAYARPFDGVGKQSQLTRITLDHQDALRADSDFPERMRMLDEHSSSFNGIAAHYPVEFSVVSGNRSATVAGGLVSANFFDVLQMQPAAGRFLRDFADERSHEAVISHRLWADHFANSPGAIGSTITVNGVDVAIVGVAAEGFRGVLEPSSADDLWIPASASVAGEPRAPFIFTGLGRLSDGVTQRSAQTEQSSVHVTALRRSELETGILLALLMLPAVIFILACSNASSLVLANATARSACWRTHLVLGAGRWRLIRQKLTEDLLLAMAAAGVGLLLTGAAIRILEHSIPLVMRVDYRIVLSTALVAVVAPLLFGLVPAYRAVASAWRIGVTSGRLTSSHNSSVLLIALQSAVALGLLCTGAQFLQTIHLRGGDDGLRTPERLVVAKVDTELAGLDAQQTNDLYAAILDRIRFLPSVAAAAQSCDCDLWGHMTNAGAAMVSTPSMEAPRRVVSIFAGGDFFETVRLPLLDGTLPDDRVHGKDAVVVNDVFAQRIKQGSVGEILRIAPIGAVVAASRWVVVSGVVGAPRNTRSGELARRRHDIQPTVYYTVPLIPLPVRKLYVEFEQPPGVASQRALQGLLTGSAPGVTLRSIATGDALRRRNQASSKWVAHSVTSIGIVALLLATGGLFCLVSSSVSHSAKEIAIRMALGASPVAVSTLFVRRAFYPVGVGCALGGVIAASTAGVLQSRLYGASLFDPEAFGMAALALLLAMSFASVIPAMRAARTEPCQMLRSE